MAHLADIPFRYYNAETDQYRLHNGLVIDAWIVEKARQERQDEINASRAYDPYNHKGRFL